VIRALLALLALLAFVPAPMPALANDSLPPAPYAYTQLADPAQEKVARELMDTLRCLVCQGESIADSNASEQPEAIRAWLIQRYGSYVSYKPVMNAATWPLFAAPVALLALAAFLLRGRFARRKPEDNGA
jgi:cytochrome c-type biogenesis protein CcmH/NrfF